MYNEITWREVDRDNPHTRKVTKDTYNNNKPLEALYHNIYNRPLPPKNILVNRMQYTSKSHRFPIDHNMVVEIPH